MFQGQGFKDRVKHLNVDYHDYVMETHYKPIFVQGWLK